MNQVAYALPPAPPLADGAPGHAFAVRFSKTDALALKSPTCLKDEHGGTYTFDGFLVLCHYEVTVPVLEFLCGGGLVEARFDEVAAQLEAMPEVAHNYRREHQWNMWFVLGCETPQGIAESIARIEAKTGLAVLNLPKEETFHVGLHFPV